MAFLMRICELTERNSIGGNPYRYMVGMINDGMRVIVMPNRDKQSEGDPAWVLYFAPVAQYGTEKDPEVLSSEGSRASD